MQAKTKGSARIIQQNAGWASCMCACALSMCCLWPFRVVAHRWPAAGTWPEPTDQAAHLFLGWQVAGLWIRLSQIQGSCRADGCLLAVLACT
jgi:hypothetical protein